MIVNPNDSDHLVKITPRYFPTNTLNIRIKDSVLDTNTIVSVAYLTTNDNKLELLFSYDFSDERSYSISITDTISDELVFRGLVLATTQITQDYSTSDVVYNWK